MAEPRFSLIMESELRGQIRNSSGINFQDSALEKSMEKRYSIQTVNSTAVRFRNKVKTNLNLLEKYREFNFSGIKVDTLELVYNNWYQRIVKVRYLENV